MDRLAFGPWTPDRHPISVGRTGLLVADNVVPAVDGYRPFPSWTEMAVGTSVVTVLSDRARGSIGGTRSDGANFHFAGTGETLEELQSTGFVDVSRAGSPAYSLGATEKWDFEQFAGTILAAGGPGVPLQKFEMGVDSVFADVSGAPNARHVAIFGRQVFCGNLSTDPNGLHWGAQDNPVSWPTPGDPSAISVLSDTRSLQRGGTEIRDLVAYGDVGGVFKDGSIWRVDFHGGDVMWDVAPMIENVGLLAHGMAIPFAGSVLFPSARGWFLWGYGTDLTPVGDQVLDDFFKADLQIEYASRMSWALDPDDAVAAILYPGQGSIDGFPNRMLLYDFSLGRWSLVRDPEIELVANAVQPSASLTLETIPQVPLNESQGSFDDPTAPVTVHLSGYSASHELGLFEGANREALLVTGDAQHFDGLRAAVTGVRPLVDTDPDHLATVAIGAKTNRSDDVLYTTDLPQNLDADGECQDRVDARYHRYKVKVPAGSTTMLAMGLEIAVQPSGDR